MIDKKNCTIVFLLIYYYIYLLLYYIIYYYIFIFIYYYIYIYIIIYIVMCPKNGTIFMLRVPGMGLFIFCLVYVYIGNDIGLVESTPGVVFFICIVGILQRVIFIF